MKTRRQWYFVTFASLAHLSAHLNALPHKKIQVEYIRQFDQNGSDYYECMFSCKMKMEHLEQ